MNPVRLPDRTTQKVPLRQLGILALLVGCAPRVSCPLGIPKTTIIELLEPGSPPRRPMVFEPEAHRFRFRVCQKRECRDFDIEREFGGCFAWEVTSPESFGARPSGGLVVHPNGVRSAAHRNRTPSKGDYVAATSAASDLDELQLAFPSQPIGLGARWRLHRRFGRHGFRYEEDVEYRLVEAAASGGSWATAVVEANTHALAPWQEYSGPGTSTMSPLDQWEVRGRARLRYERGWPHPAGVLDIETTWTRGDRAPATGRRRVVFEIEPLERRSSERRRD